MSILKCPKPETLKEGRATVRALVLLFVAAFMAGGVWGAAFHYQMPRGMPADKIPVGEELGATQEDGLEVRSEQGDLPGDPTGPLGRSPESEDDLPAAGAEHGPAGAADSPGLLRYGVADLVSKALRGFPGRFEQDVLRRGLPSRGGRGGSWRLSASLSTAEAGAQEDPGYLGLRTGSREAASLEGAFRLRLDPVSRFPLRLQDPAVRLAIVIDDFGDTWGPRERAVIALPYPVTIAVMPGRLYSRKVAAAARLAGQEVIVHMPMQPHNEHLDVRPLGGLTVDMSREEMVTRLNTAVEQLPEAVGMNNHQGSRLTTDERAMRIVAEFLAARGLFFLDSRTYYGREAGSTERAVRSAGLPYVVNGRFIDAEDPGQVCGLLYDLVQKTPPGESVVVIGHITRSATVEALVRLVPLLRVVGVQFVSLSTVVTDRVRQISQQSDPVVYGLKRDAGS